MKLNRLLITIILFLVNIPQIFSMENPDYSTKNYKLQDKIYIYKTNLARAFSQGKIKNIKKCEQQ